MVAGGLPCQGFSLRGKRDSSDRRNRLFEHYLRVVDLISPNIVLLENVHGIALPFGQNTRDDDKKKIKLTVAEEIAEELDKLNYRFFSNLVDSSLYGVPQSRSRYIMIGVKKSFLSQSSFISMANDPFSLLEQLRECFLAGKGLLTDEAISAEVALSDLERKHGEQKSVEFPRFQEGKYGPMSGCYQELLRVNRDGSAGSKTIPDSHRFANHKESTIENFTKLMKCERGIQLSREERERLGIGKHDTIPLAPDKPCHTLTTLPDDCIHYAEPRIFTVREYARIQSFPDWFELKGKYTTGGKQRKDECPRYTQVGNAVPPLLGEALGLALKSFIRGILPTTLVVQQQREPSLSTAGV
jgi:DNA (cytosine-5)-methyltransferase 1